MATASPQLDSTRPYRGRPLARAASEPRNRQAALAWHAACTRPTRCWSRCSADQSASPVAAAGRVTATPVPISIRAARSVPRNRSSRTAEVQHPSGSRTSAGCAGCPNGTPCSASVLAPRGQGADDPVGQPADHRVERVRLFDPFGQGRGPAGPAGLAVLTVPADGGEGGRHI